MISLYFDKYYQKHPDVILEILDYFDVTNLSYGQIEEKSVLNFCERHKDGEKSIYSPFVISAFCKRLNELGILLCLRNSGSLGYLDNYYFKPLRSYQSNKKYYNRLYSSLVYGLDYVYELYKNIVVPLVWEKEDGLYAAATGFRFLNGIVTAKHCLTDVKNLKIKGFTAAQLQGKPIYVSNNEGVDLAFIETGGDVLSIPYEEGQVMQQVLVLGYPKIPTFTPFLTSEIATISSKASARLTPTCGSIAATGQQYLTKMGALLITAKIRGGNSGGPVINERGHLVGIACQLPYYDKTIGDYDDLGYGIAIPVSYLLDIISKKAAQLNVVENFYRDFVEED